MPDIPSPEHFDLIFVRHPEYRHDWRQRVFQYLAENLAQNKSIALLFGTIHSEPKLRRGDLIHFNLRLAATDEQGLHCVVPKLTGDQLTKGDQVMLLAQIMPRQYGKGPNPVIHVVFMAVSES